ncbi:hypothetical protein DFR74_10317 [Nocardia puris]|uniref:Uncharacterized protein n=1 Tax=Nocardia puris TaxID=208602 RepID=A0A366DR49_9NOCA|nr:hypothetical protein DFR74_10317 [Nocardia puris]
MWALCDSVRLELRHLGVGVGSAHPTFFRTPMMDFVHADPAGNVLWGGDSGGLWKIVALETVVADIISGSNSAPTSSSSPGPTRCPPASPASSVRSSIESDSGGNTIREALALAAPAPNR